MIGGIFRGLRVGKLAGKAGRVLRNEYDYYVDNWNLSRLESISSDSIDWGYNEYDVAAYHLAGVIIGFRGEEKSKDLAIAYISKTKRLYAKGLFGCSDSLEHLYKKFTENYKIKIDDIR